MPIEFFVLGANHRTAGIDLRERLALSPGQQQSLTARLLSGRLTQEAAALCTCNRFEVYGVSGSYLPKEQLLGVLEEAAGLSHLDAALFYYYCGRRALGHLFRVASSLDSQIVGETHILGQVKDCYQQSRRLGTAAKWLNIFFQKSFQVAKKVRSQTAVTALPVSTGSCAVAVARRIFGELEKCRVLVVGAGQIGHTVARHFSKHGVTLTVSNRTHTTAQTLSAELGGTAIDFGSWQTQLPSTDIAVFATSSREPLLTVEAATRVTQVRKRQPLLLLDLSVPRNLDPAVGRLESVFLYDIDNVQSLVDIHYAARVKEAQKAEEIIADWVQSVWDKTSNVAPGVATVPGGGILSFDEHP